jgi:hypothetical protein
MKRQNEMIVAWCKTHKGITSAEALFNLGIGSLSRRICDLEEAGYKVIKTTEKGINRHTGAPCRWIRYHVSQTPLFGGIL